MIIFIISDIKVQTNIAWSDIGMKSSILYIRYWQHKVQYRSNISPLYCFFCLHLSLRSPPHLPSARLHSSPFCPSPSLFGLLSLPYVSFPLSLPAIATPASPLPLSLCIPIFLPLSLHSCVYPFILGLPSLLFVSSLIYLSQCLVCFPLSSYVSPSLFHLEPSLVFCFSPLFLTLRLST